MAAPTVGTVTNGVSAGSVSTLTVATTPDTGCTLLIAVFQNGYNGFSQTSVTYDGNAMTKLVEKKGVSDDHNTSIWAYANPTIGVSKNVVFTISGSNASEKIGGCVIPVIGSKTSGYSNTTATATNASVNITPTVNDTLLIDAMITSASGSDTAPTPNGSQTSRQVGHPATNKYMCVSTLPLATAGTQAMAWTVPTQNTDFPQHCAVAIESAAAGPTNLKSYDTNAKANIKSINTNVIANIKSLNTNT